MILLFHHVIISLHNNIALLLREKKTVSLVSPLSCFIVLIQYFSLEIKHSVFGDLIVYTLFWLHYNTLGLTSSQSLATVYNIYRESKTE